jgi:hypothetical protein
MFSFCSGSVGPAEDSSANKAANPLQSDPFRPAASVPANGGSAASLPASPMKPRSREAAAILESFPLLNFMQSQVLAMPDAKLGQ